MPEIKRPCADITNFPIFWLACRKQFPQFLYSASRQSPEKLSIFFRPSISYFKTFLIFNNCSLLAIIDISVTI